MLIQKAVLSTTLPLTMVTKVARSRNTAKAIHIPQVLFLRLQSEFVVDHTRSTSNLHRCRVKSSGSGVFLQMKSRTKLTILGPSKQHDARYCNTAPSDTNARTEIPRRSKLLCVTARMVAHEVKAKERPVEAPKARLKICPVTPW